MKRIETSLPGVLILEPTIYADERGFFLETYHEEKFAALGVTARFVQDNASRSVRGVVRGLHYQRSHSQAKLCRVVQGEVFDVCVDLRQGSPTFGQWYGVVLSAANQRQIFVPEGFAHGFQVLSETADFLYKCSDFYAPDDEYGLVWNDPAVGIKWMLADAPLIAPKDAMHPRLSQIPQDSLFRYREEKS